ncbi:MAG: S-layer homology domain-containing protein, partial [Monoglobales bacterium]
KKMKKRLLTLLLFLILVITSSFTALADDVENEGSTGLSASEQVAIENEFKVLDAIGLKFDYSKAFEPLSRIELAEIAIKMYNVPIITNGNAFFADVPLKHWGFDIVNTVASYGLMSGDSEYMFLPEKKASFNDGIKTLMGLLGYMKLGSQVGWSDAEYISRARQIGILKNIEVPKNNEITMYTLAKMFVNMLDKPVLEAESVVGQEVNFKTDKNNDYLKARFGFYNKTGVVQAANFAALRGNDKLSENKVKIDDLIYNANGVDYSNFLGYTVHIIADSDITDSPNILYCDQAKSVEEVFINAEDIKSFSDYCMQYYENGNLEKVYIDTRCQVVLNGSTRNVYDENDLKPLAGSVKFVDADGDGNFELVFVTSILYYRVGGIYRDDLLKDSITNNTVNLKDVKVSCFQDGKETDIYSLSRGAIIAVMPDALIYSSTVPSADNTNMKKLKVDVVTSNVTGKLSAVSENSCIIEGQSYKYSKYIKALIAGAYLSRPQFNDENTLYLNSEGIVVLSDRVSEAASGSRLYGYLIKVSFPRRAESNAFIKLYTHTGEMKSFETAETFFINDVRTAVDDISTTRQLFVNGEVKPQFVSYKLDNEGKIKYLYLAKNRVDSQVSDVNGNLITNPYYQESGYVGYDEDEFSLNYKAASGYYRPSYFDHKYEVAEDTVIFIIPNNIEDEDLFKIVTPAYFKSAKRYPIYVYDVDENYRIKNMVIDYTTGAENKDLNYSLNDGIVSYIIQDKWNVFSNDEEKIAQKALGYTIQNLNFQNYIETNLIASRSDMTNQDTTYKKPEYIGIAWADLMPGDVIQVEFDDYGEVERFRIIFRYSDLYDGDGNVVCKVVNNNTTSASSMYNTVGIVKRVFSDGSFVYNIDPAGNASGMYLVREFPLSYNRGKIRVFIYDKDKNYITTGSLIDVKEGDAVFVRSEYGAACEVFIYR